MSMQRGSTNNMNPGRLGVWYAADKLSPGEWARFIMSAESFGYEALWYSESRGFESMALGSYLLFSDVGLRGGLPDGSEDPTWRGRNGERNALFANSWLRPVCGCPRAAACCSPIFRVRRTPACVRSRSTFPARSPKADDRAAFASPAGS